MPESSDLAIFVSTDRRTKPITLSFAHARGVIIHVYMCMHIPQKILYTHVYKKNESKHFTNRMFVLCDSEGELENKNCTIL